MTAKLTFTRQRKKFKMKLSTGIIAVVLLFTFMEATNGTLYRNLRWYNKVHRLGYGCYKSTCWAYCGASWTSGEWCYSSQFGPSIKSADGAVGHSHAGYQSCSRDSQCTNKVVRCVGACTL